MVGKTVLMRELSGFKARVASAVGLQALVLFGSQAEGRARKDSDMDLMVVSAGFRNRNYFRRAALMYDYWDALIPADFLCYAPEEFKKLSRDTTIVSYALKYGITI